MLGGAIASQENIARIANAVHCHSLLSGNKNCHEFKFSIVRIVMSISNATSLYDCSLRMGGGGKKFDMLVGTSGT